MAKSDAGVGGDWDGRLIDVAGFEGRVRLSLRAPKDRKVTGTFSAVVAGHHRPMERTGNVVGTLSGEALTLTFTLNGKSDANIALKAQVIAGRDGGHGMCGVYDVSARTGSPLVGGVICAQKDAPNRTAKVTVTRVDGPTPRPKAARRRT